MICILTWKLNSHLSVILPTYLGMYSIYLGTKSGPKWLKPFPESLWRFQSNSKCEGLHWVPYYFRLYFLMVNLNNVVFFSSPYQIMCLQTHMHKSNMELNILTRCPLTGFTVWLTGHQSCFSPVELNEWTVNPNDFYCLLRATLSRRRKGLSSQEVCFWFLLNLSVPQFSYPRYNVYLIGLMQGSSELNKTIRTVLGSQ